MRELFSTDGVAALCGLATRQSLLSFDLDGTLAPIVARPQDAVVPAATAARMRLLASRWPVAVITGRAVADATLRLGFTPHCLVGNHGAESPLVRGGAASAQTLDGCRDGLTDTHVEWQLHGITLEDKGLSLALHYRGSADPAAARAWLNVWAAGLGVTVRATHGHSVLNIVPAAAHDKGDALREILRACGASSSLVVGDDANDEPAFIKAPDNAVSVRIGPRGVPSQARFRLADQSLVDPMLDLLLALRP